MYYHMIWINENFNHLTKDEYTILKNKCDNFILTHEPSSINNGYEKNYYYRHLLDKNDIEIKPIIDKVTNIIKETINKSRVDILGLWINKVNSDSNKNDDFHKDSSDLTFLLYLNENFDGGEFEYINGENQKIKIKPKINLSIISNDKLYHRVSPVINGERFSLVMFFGVGKKKENTLI